MHINPGTAVLINLALAVYEYVEASSYSDDGGRLRGSSEFGNNSDIEVRNSHSSSSGNPTPNPYSITGYNQSMPPLVNHLTGYANSHAAFQNSPYYKEYLERALKYESDGVDAVDHETSMKQIPGMQNSENSDHFVIPSLDDLLSFGDERKREAFKFEHVSNPAFVEYPNSNQGVPTSSTASTGIISEPSSLTTTSPSLGERNLDSKNLSEADATAKEIYDRVTLEKDNEFEDESEDYLHDFEAYRLNMDMNINRRFDIKHIRRPPSGFENAMQTSEIKSEHKTSRNYLLKKVRDNLINSANGFSNECFQVDPLNSIASKAKASSNKDENSKRPKSNLVKMIEDSIKIKAEKDCQKLIAQESDQKEEIASSNGGEVDLKKSISDSHETTQRSSSPMASSIPIAPTNTRRPPITTDEVCNVLVPAATIPKSGSISSLTNQLTILSEVNNSNNAPKMSLNAVSEPAKLDGKDVKRDEGLKMMNVLDSKPLKKKINSQESVLIPAASVPKPLQKQQQQQQQQKQQDVPPQPRISFFEWRNMFRLPRAYSPPTKLNPNRFRFPMNEHTSNRFLKQLKSFRKGLKYSNGKRLNVFFEDYEPNLNYVEGRAGYEVDRTDRKKARKNSLTDSQPIKIFNAPPERTWIPVRCDALGFNFKVLHAGIGHSGNRGRKAHVSVVYDANKETKSYSKDPNGAKVTYISKEYYDMEYFLNEYNFFQFAHSPYIPKPYCVIYGPNPKIIMEHIPGDRVHHSLFYVGQNLRKRYPDDRDAQVDAMKTLLIKILAKILVTIKYIHSIGFIVADIKPENIMFDTQSGRVVLLDFDLTVSAPYIFTGRGTETTIAPELNGLLQGPVHFGIDWWAYGSTAAMIISAGFAGVLFDEDSESEKIEKYFNYVPFRYLKEQNRYEMTLIPEFFPPAMRSFLYPFFSPDPSLRVFSEHFAYEWIRKHPLFSIIEWPKYENLDLGYYSVATPMHIGLSIFYKRPVFLLPHTMFFKFMNGISSILYLGNMFSDASAPAVKDGSLANVEDSGDEDDEGEEVVFEDDSDEDVGNVKGLKSGADNREEELIFACDD